MKNITIIGSGAYGTALASVLLDNEHNVTILGVDKNEIDDININHKNSKYFPEYKLDKSIKAVLDWEEGLKDADVLVLAIPSKFLNDVCTKINKYSKRKMGIINASKGFGQKSLEIPHELLDSTLKPNTYEYIGGIYGPSIAEEVLSKEQLLIVATSNTIENADKITKIFKNNYFIVYSSENIKMIEYSVILKNIYAISVGMSYAIFSSKSTIASIISIAISEIRQIIGIYTNNSVKNITFDIASLADIILTTTSDKSRNFSLGFQIGKNNDVSSVLKNYKLTVEGLESCKMLCDSLIENGHNLPLISILYDILFNEKTPSIFLKSIFNKKLHS